MAVRPVPKGYHTITPYLTVARGREFVAFLKKAFGAKSMGSMDSPAGTIAHAEVQIGDSMLMLAEPMGGEPVRPVGIYLFVPESDKVFRKAIAAGATEVMPMGDQFWGDRGGCVRDPFGNTWWISTRRENLSSKEIGRRAKAFFASMAGGAGPEATSMKKPVKSSESKVVAQGGARGRIDKKIEPASVAARRRSAPASSAIPTAARVVESEERTMENPGHMGVGGTAPPAPPPTWREEIPGPLSTPAAPTPRRKR